MSGKQVTSDLSPGRDHRIDFFRGLALVMIFINHIPDNVLGLVTTRNFGFSDGAEAFVLLSGISAGIAYSPKRIGRSVFQPWARVFTLWWVQAIVALSIYLLLMMTLKLPGVAEMAAERNVAPVLADPRHLLIPVLLLAHQFNCADILPLYIMLLLAAPGIIAIGWRWPAVLLLFSVGLWFFVGCYSINMRLWGSDNSWYFNPLSWQLVFSIGILIGLARSKGQRLTVHPWLVALSVLFLVFSAAWMQVPEISDYGYEQLAVLQRWLGGPDYMISFEKTFLPPLRLLHIIALSYVLSSWPIVKDIAQSRWSIALVIMGRNALPVFATGSILIYAIQIIRQYLHSGPIVDVVLIGVGLNITLLVALFRDRAKGRYKPGLIAQAG